jgi:hypothetical protein
MQRKTISLLVGILTTAACLVSAARSAPRANEARRETDSRPRVIATTDGEIDDQCSMVRFLLYANEWDIEGIVTSSSQYHWRGHRWAGDDWIEPYLDAYEDVYPNLVKHDPRYPTPQYLRERHVLGNVDAEGEMDKVTPGSKLIVRVLLNETDDRPVWLQAWGGPNTIARALKTIEERHPDKVEQVAKKVRLFLIWEQDDSYQEYIRPRWEKRNILSVISDQFDAIAYESLRIIPEPEKSYFVGKWIKEHILNDHGPLCSLYRAKDNGDFRSEGDSPSFMHSIDTGLRNMENPGWGGWGGRYVKVRNNIWLDPIEGFNFTYPEGRWYGSSALGRKLRKAEGPEAEKLMREYYRPIWRWSIAFQNDWAARADWCIADSYGKANHPPTVRVAGALNRNVRPSEKVELSARESSDPDADFLSFKWWRYDEVDTAESSIHIDGAASREATFTVPNEPGKTIHIIAEVTDKGTPPLTRYQRIVFSVQ